MDIGTGIATGLGAMAAGGTIIGTLRALKKLPNGRNGGQTNKEVNTSISNRLDDWKKLMCDPFHEMFKSELLEAKKEIDKTESRLEKAIEKSEQNITTQIKSLTNLIGKNLTHP